MSRNEEIDSCEDKSNSNTEKYIGLFQVLQQQMQKKKSKAPKKNQSEK